MSAKSLSSQAREMLTDEDKRDDVILYLSKNSEATSQELRNLASAEEDAYDRRKYVAVARSLNELGYVESEIDDSEIIWVPDEDFSYNSVVEKVEEALENPGEESY
ncbi:MAG: hypothetical protein ACI9LV_000963 [Candidatus Nanohaloarchaea archaeon]|jgi:hypothetical protein